jgi:hypothetical protein
MDAKELRIGNYVLDDENLLSQIIGFSPFEHSYRCDEKEGCNLLINIYPEDGTIRIGYEIDINFCKPIELTEEWLLKFGKIDWISKDIDGIFFWFNGEKKYIKFVHSLQNTYFCIEQKELI